MKQTLPILLLLVALSFSTSLAAYGECACMQAEREAAARANREAAARNTPSENERQTARRFQLMNLPLDAQTSYQSALEKAEKELAYAQQQHSAGQVEFSLSRCQDAQLHLADIEHDLADLYADRENLKQCAQLREQALNHEIAAAKPELDLEREYSKLSSLFSRTEQYAKAADYFKKLADLQEHRVGRYSARLAEPLQNYSHALLKAGKTSQAAAVGARAKSVLTTF